VLVVIYTDRGEVRRIISARLANRKERPMAVTRMTLADAQAHKPDIDRAKMDATSEADIRRHMVDDGEDPDAPLPGARLVVPPAAVRQQLGMTQQQFAELIGVPVGTLRNWEQGRVMPDPAARSLLTILSREPKAALRALRAA
jgi:putative transcriptional regulator